MKKLFFILFLLFNALAVYYLISPTPVLPDLPDSVKSDLPGDTTQLTNVAAYYTDLSRQQVMDFYQRHYRSPLRLRLNHPPERSKVIFRDTMQSYYLEEFVLPFKESLYVNGFEWENDVFTKPEKRITNQLIYHDRVYKSKVTVRTFPTSPPRRLAVLFGLQAFGAAAFLLYRSFLKNDRR